MPITVSAAERIEESLLRVLEFARIRGELDHHLHARFHKLARHLKLSIEFFHSRLGTVHAAHGFFVRLAEFPAARRGCVQNGVDFLKALLDFSFQANSV